MRVFFRGESILLFLVQTVGRQMVEQRQYRAPRSRSASATSRKTPSSDLGISEYLYFCTQKLKKKEKNNVWLLNA